MLRKEVIRKPLRGKKIAEISHDLDKSPRNTFNSPSESKSVGTKEKQDEVPLSSSQGVFSASDRLFQPRYEFIEIRDDVEGGTFVKIIPVTPEDIDEVIYREARASTARISNSAAKGETLVQVFVPDDSEVLLSSERLGDVLASVMNRLRRTDNKGIPREVSAGESRQKESARNMCLNLWLSSTRL